MRKLILLTTLFLVFMLVAPAKAQNPTADAYGGAGMSALQTDRRW